MTRDENILDNFMSKKKQLTLFQSRVGNEMDQNKSFCPLISLKQLNKHLYLSHLHSTDDKLISTSKLETITDAKQTDSNGK